MTKLSSDVFASRSASIINLCSGASTRDRAGGAVVHAKQRNEVEGCG